MDALFSIINKPLGLILKFVAGLFNGNFAAAVFVFTLLINIVLIPLSLKSQKSSVQQTRIKPKLDELKKRYGDDKQKYNEAMQKLYQEENVSMAGGCLPMILRLVIMMSIYYLIMSPLTYMTGVDKTKLDNVTTTISTSLSELKKEDEKAYNQYKKELNWQEGGRRNELGVVSVVRERSDVLSKILTDAQYKKIENDLKDIAEADAKAGISYNFFTKKINLTESPEFGWNIADKWRPIWIMPLLAFAAQILSSLISMKVQKKINPEAPTMSGMLLTMPLISLFIGFALPGGVTFYWACSSLVGGLIQTGLQVFYGPHKMLAKERIKELNKQCEFEDGQLKKFTANEAE